jgi:hypothetical protein
MRKTALFAIGIGLLLAGCGAPAPPEPDYFALFMATCTKSPAPYTAASMERMCGCGWHATGAATDPGNVKVASTVCSNLLVREK